MAFSVPIELGYEFSVKSPFEDVFAVLSDVPKSVSHFPKVDRLVDEGKGVYRWEMKKVGHRKSDDPGPGPRRALRATRSSLLNVA